ncbi:UNVERIFIED_CONTAM: hypothetical protein FKN15_019541 [Acipenser sinensis]
MNLDPSNFPGVKLRPKVSIRSYGSREGSVSGRSGESSPVPMGSHPRRGLVNGSRESTGYLEELEKERSLLLAELEKEEKEKDWYYAQLQNLTKRIDSFPLTENFSLQTDMTRRQLEYEARQIRAAMEEQLGTCQDMEKRAQARVARIQQIEKDMLRIRQHLQAQTAESEKTSQSKHDPPSRDAERQNEGGQAAAELGMGTTGCVPSPVEHQICPAVCVLMKLSFDEEHRHAMNELGGLQAIGELLQVDCEMYGLTNDHYSVTLRRYAGMALTNLTFGDVANKVIASVLRNLSWRADVNSKKTLREVGSVKALMECALEVKKESTLKSVLSALWNLSAHCTENKADICAVDGALAFLVSALTYRSQTNTLAIIESGGGILRNVSSLIATNEDHRQILRENNCLQTLLQHLKSHSLTIVSNACGTLWNLSARNVKDQEALWDMGAVSMLKNLIHSKHKMIAMGSAAALRNLMANRPAKYKDANIMSPGSSLPSLHVRKQKALIEELDAQHLSETFDNIDNLSPKASHRNKQRHKQNVYSEYVLDSGRHNEDGMCRSESFNTTNVTVLSPYMNTTVLPSSASSETRGNAESSRAEKDRSTERERRGPGPGGFHPSENSSKRIGMQISTTAAQIAKVMEEVQSIHISQDDGSTGSSADLHCRQEERSGPRRASASHTHSNVYHFNKQEHPSRTCPMPYGKVEYRASNDSLNSVSSSDGYGKRGQMKPSVESYSEDDDGYGKRGQVKQSVESYSEDDDGYGKRGQVKQSVESYSEDDDGYGKRGQVKQSVESYSEDDDGYGKRGQVKQSVESYSEDDEGKFCSYGKYPADLAHKIHSANHMEDNDGEMDTPINYSLKYSDEQLNSGRQSPSQNERWPRPKHLVEDEMKRNEQKTSRTQNQGYSIYTENSSEAADKHMKFPSRFGQPECPGPFRQRGCNGSEQSRSGSNHGMKQKMNPSHCPVDDYDDDKPTNYSERYSEEEQHDEEDQPTNYGIKYSEEHHHAEPIDYSIKYSSEVPSSQKYGHSKTSTVQNSTKDHITQGSGSTSGPSTKNSVRQKQLHPSSAQTRAGPARVLQKSTTGKAPSINQETIQTYCVEDTPICFSRGSSLSSLSSAEDEMEGREQHRNVANNYPTLPIADKEASGSLCADMPMAEDQSSSQYTRMKAQRHQSSNVASSDGSRHKAVEFSSGAKSPFKSGAQTPKSPPEHYVQETPLMFSRCTSVSSLDSFESHSIASSVQSEPCSGMVSGIISPSDLPDSPGQTMPPSRSKTPPPPHAGQMKNKVKVPNNADERELAPRHVAVNAAIQRVQVLPDNDILLHFATESTPDGFSCSSSLSALSLDEPFIQKDVTLQIMSPVHEDDHGNDGEPEKEEDTKEHKSQNKPPNSSEPEKDILNDSDDDDIDILEECINSAMPTKSSRKTKKPPPVARKPSQLPVYKLLPSQNRGQQQKNANFTHGEDMPRVYCVEGTPINFSTATSLSDLTIESPPNELANTESSNIETQGTGSSTMERRDTIPMEGRSIDGKDAVKSSAAPSLPLGDEKAEGDDILAECISSAMPKGKSHNPFRVKKIIGQVQQTSTSPGNPRQQDIEKKKPTSPVKPMPQSSEYRARVMKPPNNFSSGSYPDKNKDAKKRDPKNSRECSDKAPNSEERVRGSFAFDSPHHYSPIEGTPYCFSRNDSLSSLDFDDDELDFSKEKAELRKEKEHKKASTRNVNEQTSNHPSASRMQVYQRPCPNRGPARPLLQKQATFPQASKDNTGSVTDEKMQNFSIEDTPVCFSRNSSLSSLSDIDQENNNKESSLDRQKENSSAQVEGSKPQASGYAPKAFNVEDTPVCFSRNSSLSSLSIDSEDDLLQECISSAMPKKKKQPAKSNGGDNATNDDKHMGGILTEEPDLTLDLRHIQSPISEQAHSPDSETFDWKAIQEGANSIVSSLHQAAAASLSRQASSDSDSVLSLKSGISLGSPFHLASDQEEKPVASNKGPRILKPGEKSTSESRKKEEEQAKALKGGKKVYKSLITGKARSSVDISSIPKQQAPVPLISRGRTMIHIPGIRNSSPSTSPIPKKTPPKNTPLKAPTTGQISSNSPRGVKTPVKSDPNSANRQQGAQGGSSKGSSRSGSRDTTPSRPAQQPLSRPVQSPGRTSVSPGRNGISPTNKLSQLPRTSSPSTASTKSSGSGRMSYTSPGRHLGQQTPTKQSCLPRSTSGIPRSESASKGLNQSAATGSAKKVELSRMSSTKSSGSESDKSERPVLVRQSTFIKEAPSPTLKRKLEESASFESLSPASRPVSPNRSQSHTPVLSPSLPDMSLTLPYQGSCWRKSPQSQNSSENGDDRPLRRHDIARSHSESPSRLPINRSGTWKREHSKHSSSLPRVSTWKRTGSSSSILSASSESSEKGKSEDERQHASFAQGSKQSKEIHTPLKGTWRKIKESENPQNPSDDGSDADSMVHQMAPAVSKTEDVWVRIEDCPINNPRSGKSPTGNTPPIIDSVPEKLTVDDPDPRDTQSKQSAVNDNVAVCTTGLEHHLNSFIMSESPEKKAAETKSVASYPAATPETSENPVTERTPFSSTNSSKHSSPSGAVAARVTPFNYNPNPRKSSTDNGSARPSQIPTPINSSTKKRDSKGDSAEPSGNQSPRRLSGSYLVTSV